MVELLDPATLPLLLVVAGVIISILEAIAPGAHLVVLGVALLVAGIIGLVLPVFATPLALAAMVLTFGAAALWGYRNLDLYGGTTAGRTSDSQDLAGREGVVIERVTQTDGRVRLYDGGFDPTFSARSFDDPIPEGQDIIVVDPGGGSVLTVAALDELDADSIDRELARERDRDIQAGSAERDASTRQPGAEIDETSESTESARESEQTD